MPTKNLKKQLSLLSKDELIKHILELDKKYKAVQEYHTFYFTDDVEGLVKKFKGIIENEFYPKRGIPKMRLSVARGAIVDAKKLGIPARSMADLMLYYVETGVQFTNDYGDINEPFYNSIESMFKNTLGLMKAENILPDFEERAHKIVYDSKNIGWGFHDTLSDYFFMFYE